MANADANANADPGGRATVPPELCSDQLKTDKLMHFCILNILIAHNNGKETVFFFVKGENS